MNTENFKIRLICLLFAMICAGGYILVLYPAFQIPMFFVFLMIAIYIIATNYKNTKISKKDLISILVTILVFISLMGYFFIMSKDTIMTVMNTVYPGSRIETGGGALRKYVTYIDNIFLPYKEIGTVNSQKNILSHSAKEAVMFGLFPLGIIFSVISMIKNKKIDLFSVLLLIPYSIIGIFCVFEVPTWFAKITLLSYSASQRAIIALGVIDILLLLRELSKGVKFKNIWVSIFVSILLSFGLVITCRILNPDYVGKILAVFLLGMCFVLFSSAILYNTKYGKYIFTISIIGTMLIAGFTINPISSGVNVILDSPILQSTQEINEIEDGIWLVDAMAFPCPNYLEMAGCAVINATSIYPNMDLWKNLDKNGEYEDVYNRYAHVYMEIRRQEDILEKFILLSKDSIQVFITPEELVKLNIKYIFTVRVMEEFETENLSFELIYNENSYHIYKVNYK